MAALKGELRLAELAEKFDVHPNQVQDWKKRLVEGAEEVFGSHAVEVEHNEREVEKLYAKIGQLAMEKDFFLESAPARPMSERRASVRTAHPLSKGQRNRLFGGAAFDGLLPTGMPRSGRR